MSVGLYYVFDFDTRVVNEARTNKIGINYTYKSENKDIYHNIGYMQSISLNIEFQNGLILGLVLIIYHQNRILLMDKYYFPLSIVFIRKPLPFGLFTNLNLSKISDIQDLR